MKKIFIGLLLSLSIGAWAHLQGVVLDENGQPLVGFLPRLKMVDE